MMGGISEDQAMSLQGLNSVGSQLEVTDVGFRAHTCFGFAGGSVIWCSSISRQVRANLAETGSPPPPPLYRTTGHVQAGWPKP